MDMINNIIAPLIVALITALITWLWTKKMFKKKLEDAPGLYVQELDNLIDRVINEGTANALLNARSIVKARNDLKGSLVTISKQLNSEIDRLAREIGEVQNTFDILEKDISTRQLDKEEVFKTIQVLDRVWPAKKQQIEVEIRKMLTELGLPVEATYQKKKAKSKEPKKNNDSDNGMKSQPETQNSNSQSKRFLPNQNRDNQKSNDIPEKDNDGHFLLPPPS